MTAQTTTNQGTGQGSRKMEKEVTIQSPIEQVWKALTEAEELQRWFPTDAEVIPGPGGKITMKWDDRFTWAMEIRHWELEKRLGLTYRQDKDHEATDAEPGIIPDDPVELAVDYSLESNGNTTVVRLVHSGFGLSSNWDDEYDGVSRGWDTELQSLKFYLENHAGVDRQPIWLVSWPQGDLADIWQKFFGPEGLPFVDTPLQDLKAGDNYRIKTQEGQELSGTVVYLQPGSDFVGTVNEYNQSLLRLKVEAYTGKPEADIWLATYDLEEERKQEFKTYWQGKLNQLFA